MAKPVVLGQSTRQVRAELRISQHIVLDDVKAILDRTGVCSRLELVVSLMH